MRGNPSYDDGGGFEIEDGDYGAGVGGGNGYSSGGGGGGMKPKRTTGCCGSLLLREKIIYPIFGLTLFILIVLSAVISAGKTDWACDLLSEHKGHHDIVHKFFEILNDPTPESIDGLEDIVSPGFKVWSWWDQGVVENLDQFKESLLRYKAQRDSETNTLSLRFFQPPSSAEDQDETVAVYTRETAAGTYTGVVRSRFRNGKLYESDWFHYSFSEALSASKWNEAVRKVALGLSSGATEMRTLAAPGFYATTREGDLGIEDYITMVEGARDTITHADIGKVLQEGDTVVNIFNFTDLSGKTSPSYVESLKFSQGKVTHADLFFHLDPHADHEHAMGCPTAAPAAPAAASTPAPTAFDSGGLPAPWDAFTPAPTAAAGGANEPLMIEAANAFFAAVATANKPEAAQAAALDTLRNFLTAGYSGLGPHGTEFGTSNLGALVDGSIDVAIPPAATRKYAAAGDLTLIAYFTWETGVELTQVALVAIHEFVYDGPAVDQLRIDSTHFLVSSVPNGARDKVEEFYRATDLPADQSAEAMSILEGILAPGFEFVSDQGTIPRDAFLARVAAGMTGSAGVTTREIVASSSVVIAHYEFTDGATGLAFHGATVFHFARGNIAKVMWYHEEAQAKRNQLRTISAFYDVFDNRNATVLSLNDLVTQDFLVHSSHGSTANLTEFESRLLRMRAYMSNSTMMMDVNTTRQVSVDGNYAYTWFDNGINGLHMHGASVFRFQDVGGSLKLAEWWSYLEASPPAFRETVDSFLKVLSDSSGMPEGDRRGFLEANLLPLLADDYVASATGTANSTHLVDWALQWAVEDGPYTYEDVRLRADGSWVTAQFNLTGPNVNNGKGQDLIILFHMGWGSPPTIRMSMHFWHDIITPYKTNLAAFYESVVDGNPEEIDGMVVPGYVAYLKDTGETLDLAGFKAQVEIWKNHSVSDRREYLEDGNKVVSNYEMVVDGETRKGATVHTFESGTGLILESDFF